MKLDIVVMAHSSREHYFNYLKNYLGDNVKFSIDTPELKLGTWGNARRAWSMIDRQADYGLVIQDDAILCDDFLTKAKHFITQHQGYALNLFFGNRKNSRYLWDYSKTRSSGYVESPKLMWGVAIALPVEHIDPMIEYGDRCDPTTADDTRIKQYCLQAKLSARFPDPCLVDHRYGESLVDGIKDRERSAINYIDKVDIPKVFHQIWVGNKPEPRKWTNTWRTISGWKHILWTDKELDQLDMINRDKYEWYKKQRIYHGMADIARLEILYRYGGIYVDADTQRLKKWRDYRWHHIGLFAVRGNTAPSNHYRITNGIIGATPKNDVIGEYIYRISQTDQLTPAWDTIGGTMLTQLILDNIDNPNIAILEPYWFYPKNSRGIISHNAQHAIAQHHWGSTPRKGTGTYDN